MKKPLLDLKNIRVDVGTVGDYTVIDVTHLPTGITERAEGLNTDHLNLRLEAVIKITETEAFRQWLAEQEKE